MARPKKPPDQKYRTPNRSLGRVADEEWAQLKAAAAKRGETFTAWALKILLSSAKRESKK